MTARMERAGGKTGERGGWGGWGGGGKGLGVRDQGGEEKIVNSLARINSTHHMCITKAAQAHTRSADNDWYVCTHEWLICLYTCEDMHMTICICVLKLYICELVCTRNVKLTYTCASRWINIEMYVHIYINMYMKMCICVLKICIWEQLKHTHVRTHAMLYTHYACTCTMLGVHTNARERQEYRQ